MKRIDSQYHPSTLLTALELAKVLKVSRRTIGSWTSSGKIPSFKLGARCVRYDSARVWEALLKFERIAVG